MLHDPMLMDRCVEPSENQDLTPSSINPETLSPSSGESGAVEGLRIRMTPAEVALLQRCLAASKNYLEYGAGGSTRLALACPTIKSIVSVESDPAFISKEFSNNAAAETALHGGQLRFLMPDVGPTGAWGCPIDRSKEHLWPMYALAPYADGGVPDLILIDGRFRIACGLVAALEAPQATVLIHDYSLRSEYRLLERFFHIEERVDTLVRCRRHDQINEYAVRQLLKLYFFSPVDSSVTRLRLSHAKHTLKNLFSGKSQLSSRQE